MKKLLAMFMIALMILGLAACAGTPTDAAVKTGLHIGAPLLSIATVLRGGQP